MKNILFILSSLALVSCEDFFSQTVEIDPPPYTKQLSFHLNLTDQDSSVRLVLTRNFGILETVPSYNDYFVKEGSAELYKDGQKWIALAPLSADSSFVLVGDLPEPLQSGSTYEIRAEHPDYPKVSATQIMPSDFVVDSARIKVNSSSGQNGQQFDLIEVFLQDQPGVRNYYEVAISTINYITNYDPSTGQFDTLGVYKYPVYPEDFSDPNVAFGVKGSGLIGDQFFDGQAYKFQARIYSGYGSEYTIRVRNITEDYYRWSRSYEAKYDADENPLVEPVSVFDNLVDGLGIFSVSREKVYLVR
ncbi:MAG: DUF4249 domain-containing protein [Phycisphaerae bacterium]|nr:DUF4249 domain-containing protein [Saprospiraceae bacterium]